jgi:hypothetical protein
MSLNLKAQIQEVEAKEKFEEIGKVGGGMSAFVSSLSVMKVEGGANIYLWMYNNLDYPSITDVKSILFTASENDLQSLYELLKFQLTAEKGAEKTLKLGDATLNFRTTKNLGVSSFRVIVIESGISSYFLLSSKQLDKLFGK